MALDISNSGWWRADALVTIVVISLLCLGTAKAYLPDPPVFAAVQHYPSICYLPPDSGLCSNRDKDSFPTSPALDRISGSLGDTPTPSLASQPAAAAAVSPSSPPLLTLYYFDPTTEQCYPFGAQNCGGNDNRFESLADCQQRCRLRS